MSKWVACEDGDSQSSAAAADDDKGKKSEKAEKLESIASESEDDDEGKKSKKAKKTKSIAAEVDDKGKDLAKTENKKNTVSEDDDQGKSRTTATKKESIASEAVDQGVILDENDADSSNPTDQRQPLTDWDPHTWGKFIWEAISKCGDSNAMKQIRHLNIWSMCSGILAEEHGCRHMNMKAHFPVIAEPKETARMVMRRNSLTSSTYLFDTCEAVLKARQGEAQMCAFNGLVTLTELIAPDIVIAGFPCEPTSQLRPKNVTPSTKHVHANVGFDLVAATAASNTSMFLYENPLGLQMKEANEGKTGLQRMRKAIDESEYLRKFAIWDFSFDSGCFLEGTRERLHCTCHMSCQD